MLPFGTDTSGPSDYDIEISDPEIAQALADLIEMGLVVGSGQRRFKRQMGGVWVAVPPEVRGKTAHRV
jgi:hypothetical protein